MIAPITRDVADYLAQFNLAIIFVTPAGRIGTARGLSRASRISAAWWTQGRAAAESVLVAIGEHHPGTLEGATPPPWRTALMGRQVAKLRKALAGAAAGAPIPSLLGQVFEP